MKTLNKEDHDTSENMLNDSQAKSQNAASKVNNSLVPSDIPTLFQHFDRSKYGSVSERIEALRARKLRMDALREPAQSTTCLNAEQSQNENHLALVKEKVTYPLRQSSVSEKASVSEQQSLISPHGSPKHQASNDQPYVVILDSDDDDEEKNRGSIPNLKMGKSICIDGDDEMTEAYCSQIDSEDDELKNMWGEMAFASESSKISMDPLIEEKTNGGDECQHSFVLKDDIGSVCRICGLIERGIETIFEFQHNKDKRTIRTYTSESQAKSNQEFKLNLLNRVKPYGHDSMTNEFVAHPRHWKRMRPHQVDGFNFLCSNLLVDDPSGCILAHAPGSGKTFIVISFIQIFLAKYPQGKPLIILPKGILETWKKEFKTWQIEDVLLLDFYSLKADNRFQQLDVLKQWEKPKSILFLGYKQFSTIVCDNGGSKVTADCQEILLKGPSILILDEGHTPRNENTDILQSLARVQTPRKVVLSGTIYQNHVKEVFNILNLVRPKFLKLPTSESIVNRIMSIGIPASRKQSRVGNEAFFDLVEHTLQKDDNFERKVSVIQDLREMTRNVLLYYKGDFLEELPGLVDFTVLLNLTARQKDEAQNLRKLDKFKQISTGSTMYMHPDLKFYVERYPASGDRCSYINDKKMDKMLVKLDIRDGVKAKFFINMLGLCKSTNEKLLVFSQYVLPLKFLERVSVKLMGWSIGKEIFMITGDSTSEHREQSMEQFNRSPDAKVLFGSIKACGEGISLVGASRILILDVHLNPSVTRQAICRAFRPGQNRRVYTYRLVAADSPEQDDYFTCFRKETISQMWFEWDERSGCPDFEATIVDIDECNDPFLESPLLRNDIKNLYQR